MQTYVLVCFILLLAGFSQGLSGFGSILIATPLLATFLHIKIVIPLTALAALAITAMLAIQLRRHLDWKKIYPSLIGAIPGVPVGVFFLKSLDKGIILWILGIVLIVYSLYSLITKFGGKAIRQWWAYPFGFLAGCLGGVISAAGPPIIVYTSLQAWNKDQIKATLQGFFLVSGLVVVFFQLLTGLTTSYVLSLFSASVPLLILGTYLGSLLYGRINENQYRKIMLILLLFLGAFMIYRA